MAQGAFLLPSLLSGGGTSQTGASTSVQAQAAMLSSLFGLSPTSPPSTSSTNASKTNDYAEDVLNLSTKKPTSGNNSGTSQPSTSGISAPPTNFLNSLNFTELFALANLPPGELTVLLILNSQCKLRSQFARVLFYLNSFFFGFILLDHKFSLLKFYSLINTYGLQ